MQASKAGSTLLTLGFYPCPGSATQCTSGNNGNLQSQTISFPGLSLTQTYTYDNLNRLTAAQETGGTGWSQAYSYDPRGNRWLSGNTGLSQDQTLETPTAATWYSNSSVINRIAGFTYDSAGDITAMQSMSRSFSYDGENRQVTATINSNDASYVYDGNGQRVSKTAGGQTTVYVYDAFGNLAAEYSTQSAQSPCGTATCYLTDDHLGSARLLTDSNGAVQQRYDYLPFGEELGGTNGRTTALGYHSTFGSPDAFGPKFTGQMRDQETALDWFNVRHMSGAQGRFQSPDPGNAGADPADPQTWNMYAHVGNNPLTYTDPSGQSWVGDLFGVFAGIGAFFASGLNPAVGISVGLAAAGAADTSEAVANAIFDDGAPPTGVGLNLGSFGNPGFGGLQVGLGSGGGLNTGGVFGGGNAGPFIFGEQPLSQAQLDSQLNQVVWITRVVSGISILGGPLTYPSIAGFINHMVKSGGPWDFKNQPYKSAHPELDNYGNCHFGAIAHASGLPDPFTRWAAGYASYRDIKATGHTPPKSFGTPWSGPPWGDAPENQVQIRIGQDTGKCTQ